MAKREITCNHPELYPTSWQRRAEAQLEITRAAIAILAAPYQIWITSGQGRHGYLLSKKEFEDLQRAVESYKQCAEQEKDSAAQSDRSHSAADDFLAQQEFELW